MPSTDFDAFVARLKTEGDDLKHFWADQRDEYISSVDHLYLRIEKYLSDYIKSGSIGVDYEDIELNEEDTGIYRIRKCLIGIGHRSVVLRPEGTQLIGAKGRIDVLGGYGRSRLVLVDARLKTFRLDFDIHINGRPSRPAAPNSDAKPIEWTWKIISKPPAVNFLDLDRESFFNLLLDVANG